MIGVANDHIFAPRQPLNLQRRVNQRQRHNAKIHQPLLEQLGHLFGRLIGEMNVNVGELGTKRLHQAGQDIETSGIARADLHSPRLHALISRHLLLNLRDHAQNLLGAPQNHAPHFGQENLAVAPFKERCPQLGFQRLDLEAKRGLRQRRASPPRA